MDGRGATCSRVAQGHAEPPVADPILFVDNVTIKKSRGTGIWLQQRSTFIDGKLVAYMAVPVIDVRACTASAPDRPRAVTE